MFIFLIYEIILLAFLPFLIVYHLFRSLTRGRPPALMKRFGFLSVDEKEKIAGSDVIWVHAVSVGETIAAKSLLQALKKRYPQSKIVLSNVTETGRSIGKKNADVDLCIYFPFDYRLAANRVLRSVNPSFIIIIETEIWPNFLRAARIRNIPVILANGRISDRSFLRYQKLKWLFSPVLSFFSALCMQTEEDAQRIISMGSSPSLVHISKNLKYDIQVAALPSQLLSEVRAEYHIPPDLTVFTGGSTHQGEEELLMQMYTKLLSEDRNMLFVVAPRHPERVPGILELMQKEGIRYSLRSKLDTRISQFQPGEVLIIDSVGELTKIYSISDIVFIGGSLVPVGGHNVLEPAAHHVPVVFGPHMENFKEIAALIVRYHAGIQVEDKAALIEAVRLLLDNKEKRLEMGRNGARLLEENSGSTEKHMEIISSICP